MEIHNGQKYDSCYMRSAAYYLGTCAKEPSKPDEKAAYSLITGIYTVIAESPDKIGLKPSEDVYFAPWEHQDIRKSDVKTIRGSNDKVEGIIAELYVIVAESELCADGLLLPEGIKPKKTLLKALELLGCTLKNSTINVGEYAAIGLKKLSEISRENVIHITDGPKPDKEYLYFSRCVFDPSAPWVAEALDGFMNADGNLLWLCKELEARGYERIDCKDGKKISLDYVKQHGKKKEPVKMSWADKTHSGIEVTYEDLRLEPCFIWLRMPMFKDILSKLNNLPENARRFILDNTKSCNGCRYCVQTDKTGTRPLAAMYGKCPFYPSFTMNWRTLTKELAESILDVTDAVCDATK